METETRHSAPSSQDLATMKELEAQVRVCTLCILSRTRTNAVPGEGNLHAEVMFIGEGPGYHEDKQGRPFVGQAGNFLNELLGIAGLSRESAYIANVVKCRPPNNRDPEPEEIAACAPYLVRQIELINPLVIVTLGRFSMAKFFPGEKISQIHGTAKLVDGRLCVAMYHPAAGLHQASLADIIRADFRKLPIFIEQARKRLAQTTLVDEEVEEAVEELTFEEAPKPEAVAAVSAPKVVRESGPAPVEAAPQATDVQNAPADDAKKAPPAKQKKSEESASKEYEQLTFF
jgi:uracil-DNA glycosylase